MKLPGPDHPITISPVRERIVVRFHDAIVADTHDALELRESTYAPVLYIPKADIHPEHYQRTTHHTHCPYKGEASYFSLVADDAHAENAAWSYETPYPAMAEIREYVAFYPDRVSIDHEPP